MAIKSNFKQILKADELVSKEPFPINGKHQILVKEAGSDPWTPRIVELLYQSPFEGEEDIWLPIKDPATGDQLGRWEANDGFIEFEGPAGVLYRLRTSVVGAIASIHTVRNFVSAKPGR